MSDAETSCLHEDAGFQVDVSDNRKSVCDEKNYSSAYSGER